MYQTGIDCHRNVNQKNQTDDGDWVSSMKGFGFGMVTQMMRTQATQIHG